MIIELTGQPCVGKSTFIALNRGESLNAALYRRSLASSIICFFSGLGYLGFRSAGLLMRWSLREDVSLVFRLNIFRNAVTKFGIYRSLVESNGEEGPRYLIDEGLSHLPFLFINTDPRLVVELISNELRKIHVIFLASPSVHVIASRLSMRGHKRLKFLSLASFTSRNHQIEGLLLELYPGLCKQLSVA